MGLVFQSEEERNPTNIQPKFPNLTQEPSVDPCATIKEERDLLNQFIEETGHAITFDLWRAAKDEVEKMKKQYEENNGFEEVQ